MARLVRTFAVLGVVGVLASCEGGPEGDTRQDAAGALALQAEPMSGLEGMPPPSPVAATESRARPLEPRLVRNGSMRLEVHDLDAAVDLAGELARGSGGFVADSEVREGREGSRSGSMLLRVPSDSLQEVMDRAAELGEVRARSVRAEDVSREYYDLETRLAVKEQTVQRLRELVSRSGELEDLLAVERELGRATAELESLKGQIRYYDERIALSDLRLALVEPGAVITPGAFSPVVRALRRSGRVFAESVASLVYVVALVVPWLLVALLLWPLLRRVPKLIRRKGADADPAG